MSKQSQVEILGQVPKEYGELFTPLAIAFLGLLQTEFGDRQQQLLQDREARQARIDEGELPTFLPETASVRAADWRVAPIPADLLDRRVEITGPADRKMIINALNSGANVFMADFEDSFAPTWNNILDGQQSLREAAAGTITYQHPTKGEYSLNDQVATLMVRPRGLHLQEEHVLVGGVPMSASLFDFGMYFFHNAQALLDKDSGPYFYLPKLENHQEARFWNDVFVFAQDQLGIDQGSIRATVLIENILAAFEMDEILWELKDHSAGLNCGRWDYIFSMIRTFRNHPDFVLPDRGQVTMVTDFMRAYCQLLIQTCHKRGVHAMGGMAAQIPIKEDLQANQKALAFVEQDKLREVTDGHDGTWVAHPGLVGLAKEVFDQNMTTKNQIDQTPQATLDAKISAEDLLAVPEGDITQAGIQKNIDVGIRYLAAWLDGNGCVPLYNLMEDAATAEISRSQLWQWLHNQVQLDDGRVLDQKLFNQIFNQVVDQIWKEVGVTQFENSNFATATQMFWELSLADEFVNFLTLPAYQELLNQET